LKINFECQKCRVTFNSEVGEITLNEKTMRPLFGKSLICPQCGELTIDEVYLTELGQSQLTEATMNDD